MSSGSKNNKSRRLLGICIICPVLFIGVLWLSMHMAKQVCLPSEDGGARRGKIRHLRDEVKAHVKFQHPGYF